MLAHLQCSCKVAQKLVLHVIRMNFHRKKHYIGQNEGYGGEALPLDNMERAEFISFFNITLPEYICYVIRS